MLRYDNVVHALLRCGPGLLHSVELYEAALHVCHVHVVVIFMLVSGSVQSYFNRVTGFRFWRFLGLQLPRLRRLCASEFGPRVRRTLLVPKGDSLLWHIVHLSGEITTYSQ